MILESIKNEIISRILKIEEEQDIRILYCVESGSRAWGFPSSDSDYDVRFIYIHRPEWYLSIEQRRDVIEKPIIDEIDLSGWDIRKALLLLHKSNPPLLEWLSSPIVYRQKSKLADELKSLITTYYSSSACMHHYWHMAKGNFREYMQGSEVRIKKYFYILRPLLAIRWIRQFNKAVPMEFAELLVLIDDKSLKQAISDLIVRKKSGEELSTGPAIPEISQFIENELQELEKQSIIGEKTNSNWEKLNSLFRQTLKEVWE